MRVLFSIFFGIVLHFSSAGQYFNVSHDIYSNIETVYNLEKRDSTYLIFSGTRDSNNQFAGHYLIRIDDMGQVKDSNTFFLNNRHIYLGWANSIDSTVDGNYIMGGGLKDFGYLIKFNAFGDTLWSRIFGDSIEYYSFGQAIQTSDGGYAAVGEFDTWSIRSDGWLVKTDSAGNLEWEKFYSYNATANSLERLTSVQQCFDGGYILGGTTLQGPLLSSRNYDPLILKVDSLGNVKWWYVYDTPFDDAIAYAMQTYDSNYVFSSGISVSKGSSSNSRAALFKVDQSGSLMWAKPYGPVGYNTGAMVVKQLKDSSLIAAGRIGVWGPKIMGLLIHTEANGDSIFVETYENDPNGTTNQNYLWDVIPLDDGGFMAAGEVVALPYHVPFRQDAWVIRVDSNGCIVQNCLVGEKELENVQQNEVYPNPTSGIVHLESMQSFQSINVYNLQGQKVQEINPQSSSWQLPEEMGLYLIRIMDREGNIYNKKIIKN